MVGLAKVGAAGQLVACRTAAGCSGLLAIWWSAGQLGLVMVIPGWRCELTFPGLDTEGQP